MPRERWQNGSVYKAGARVKKWYGRYHLWVKDEAGKERRRFRNIPLGKVVEMTRQEAKEKLRGIVHRETGSVFARPDPDTLYGWFVEHRYLPMRQDRWKPSTLSCTTSLFKQHIIPAFQDVPLSKVNRFACQQWLNSKTGLSKSLVLKCKNHLEAVLREAVAQFYLDRNPASDLELPRYPDPTERTLTLPEAQRLLGALVNPRDRLILRIHLLCGLRPGETFALRWNDAQGRFLRIDETVNIGRNKQGLETVSTKTKASKSSVVLPESLAAELEQWRLIQQPESEDDPTSERDQEFLFPSVQAGKPLSYNTYLKDVLKPIAKGLGIPGLTFQALRRTFATRALKHGNPKDVQTQIRHTDPAMTLRVYAKEIPESVREMVEALDKELGPGEQGGRA